MKRESQYCVLDILPAQVLRLPAAAGVTISCRRGLLWVTQEGCLRDDFLSVGQSLYLSCTGLALVEAVGDAAARFALCARYSPVRIIGAIQTRAAHQGGETSEAESPRLRGGTPSAPPHIRWS